MKRYVLLVFTLLCIYVTSYAEEAKEMSISVPHLESQANLVICPDGVICRGRKTCCPTSPARTRFSCCGIPNAVCCPDYFTCCPGGSRCVIAHGVRGCVRSVNSYVLQIPAFLQQEETLLKTSETISESAECN